MTKVLYNEEKIPLGGIFMKYGFGVDLGGTTVKIAYFDETGCMVDNG